jgi:LEA14-like dessication related protein
MIRFVTVLLSALLLSSCSVYREVEVHEVTDIQLAEFGADGLDLTIWVDIENPNWYKVHLTQTEIEVFLEGKSLGTITLKETLTVPKKSRSVHPMAIHSSISSLDALLGNIFTLLFKEKFEVTGKGYVKGRAFFVVRKVDAGFRHFLTREDLGM